MTTTTTPSLLGENIYRVELITDDPKTWNTSSYHVARVLRNTPTEVWDGSYKDLPVSIQEVLAANGAPTYPNGQYTVAFYKEGSPGQTQTAPQYRVYIAYTGSRPVFPMLTGKVGCEHDYTETVLGNCYRRYNCQKCGYSFSIDSGD